jgi:dimethylargininase
MFTQAIVRTPGRSLSGITTANLGIPDYHLALSQHQQYIRALESCGLMVTVLEPAEQFPDATFVEDVALLTPECAIITSPGAPSRRDEVEGIKPVLKNFHSTIETITFPGTLEAGDVMMVGTHFFIGISERTNETGARQLISILEKYGMSGSTVKLESMLHLKTGVVYLENNTMLASGEFLSNPAFKKFNIIPVDPGEAYAANCIWVNGTVIVPEGYPRTRQKIDAAGYNTLPVDVSEFRKLDGGLSCLSLRF